MAGETEAIDGADETPEPIATFEAALLPEWEWEVHEVEQRDTEVVTGVDPEGDHETEVVDIYRGRVKSPMTHGRWESGSFTSSDLRKAGAFRTDEDTEIWP